VGATVAVIYVMYRRSQNARQPPHRRPQDLIRILILILAAVHALVVLTVITVQPVVYTHHSMDYTDQYGNLITPGTPGTGCYCTYN